MGTDLLSNGANLLDTHKLYEYEIQCKEFLEIVMSSKTSLQSPVYSGKQFSISNVDLISKSSSNTAVDPINHSHTSNGKVSGLNIDLPLGIGTLSAPSPNFVSPLSPSSISYFPPVVSTSSIPSTYSLVPAVKQKKMNLNGNKSKLKTELKSMMNENYESSSMNETQTESKYDNNSLILKKNRKNDDMSIDSSEDYERLLDKKKKSGRLIGIFIYSLLQYSLSSMSFYYRNEKIQKEISYSC